MTRPVRIVFVLSKYAVGGLEKQLASLLAHRPAHAADLEIHTITLQACRSSEVRERFERAGAINTLVDRQQLSFPRFFITLFATLKRLRPAAVSTLLDSSPGTWGRLAAWLARVSIIVHSDRLLATEGTRVHYLLRPFLDRITDRFLPNAQAIADRLVASGVPARKIQVIRNGVDTAAFRPTTVTSMRAAWGIAEDATILGYLGRFAPLKRVDLLLDAVLRLPGDHRPDALVLAGDGPTMPDIRERVRTDPWLDQHVRLLGSIDDTPAYLGSIDYLVLPSESEGLPNVLIEAMAMERPVVATAVSDVPSLVSETGLLVPPHDAAALADAIATMEAMGPHRRRELGRAARARIEANYDIRQSARRFWDAHLDLLIAHGFLAATPSADRADGG